MTGRMVERRSSNRCVPAQRGSFCWRAGVSMAPLPAQREEPFISHPDRLGALRLDVTDELLAASTRSSAARPTVCHQFRT